MKEREYSEYQRQVIRRYYENRDLIDEQRLSELVTSLFLTQGKKRARLWQQAEKIMLRLNVPESRVRHVVQSDNPAVLAAVVEDLQKGRIPKKTPPKPSR